MVDKVNDALGDNKIFRTLNITIVYYPAGADVVLKVSDTFPGWNYPFSLEHQNTSMVLLSGKMWAEKNVPGAAKSVANDLVKLLRPYRLAPSQYTIPSISSLSPSSISANIGAAIVLTVTGDGFFHGTVVRWNGSDRPTRFIDRGELQAEIPVEDIDRAFRRRGAVQVTVRNLDGGTSDSATFTVSLPTQP